MTLNNQKDIILIVSLIFQLTLWSPVFLDLSLSPDYFTAGLLNRNCVRKDGLNLLNYMSVHMLWAPRNFCPITLISFFYFTTLWSSISYGFISPLLPLPSSLCFHVLIQGGNPFLLLYIPLQGTFCLILCFVAPNPFWHWILCLFSHSFVFSYSNHNLLGATKVHYLFCLNRHGNLEGSINI